MSRRANMATFAEYTQQTMAPDNNDFTLYPYQEVWNNDHIYLPTSFAEPTYINPTTFDSFQTQQAYAHPGQDHFSFNAESHQLSKSHLQPQSPNYSPSNSAQHSFDFQHPPILSSTSDSGASVQSTISSAMGSPSTHPNPSNDWSHQHSMSLIPDIMHHDSVAQGMFPTSGFDLDTIPVTGKGCVGELTNISSSQLPQTVSPFNLPSFPSSFDLLQGTQPAGHESWSLSSTHVAPSNSLYHIPFPSTLAPHTLRGASIEATSPNDSVFKSPATPASATSPVLERVKGTRRSSAAPQAPRRVRGASPLAISMSYAESDVPPRPQAPPPTFSSPFFSQSSGHFVLPLESSCPSPLCAHFLSLFRLLFG